MLPGCARHAIELPADTPSVNAVKVEDTPPAELVACPQVFDGFPEGPAEADMPAEVRAAIVRLARGYRVTVDQLRRLIAWNTGKPC